MTRTKIVFHLQDIFKPHIHLTIGGNYESSLEYLSIRIRLMNSLQPEVNTKIQSDY